MLLKYGGIKAAPKRPFYGHLNPPSCTCPNGLVSLHIARSKAQVTSRSLTAPSALIVYGGSIETPEERSMF